MTDQVPTPPDSPWWRHRWFIPYLTLLGILAALTIVVATNPVNWDKSIGISLGFLWFAILLETGIAVAVFRRAFWRFPTTPAADYLLTLTLFALCSVGVVGFCFLTCTAAVAR